MTDFEAALYKAFLAAGEAMGERAKGMSCYYRNWQVPDEMALAEREEESGE